MSRNPLAENMNRRKPVDGGLVLARVLSVALVLLPAACAAPPASAPIQNSAMHATVVAVRPMPMPAAGGISATILAALGASPGEPEACWVEVIVRTDDGQTLSLVRPGGRVPRVGATMMLTRDGWRCDRSSAPTAPG